MSWWWPFKKKEEQPIQQGNVAANAPSEMSVPVKEEAPSAQELLEQDKELDELSSEAGLTPAAKPKAKKAKKKKAKAKKAVKKKPVKKANAKKKK